MPRSSTFAWMQSPDDGADRGGTRGCRRCRRCVVVATLAADVQLSQARLVEAVLSTGTPTVTVAMRTPYDLACLPRRAHASLQLRHRAGQRGSRCRRALRSAAHQRAAAGGHPGPLSSRSRHGGDTDGPDRRDPRAAGGRGATARRRQRRRSRPSARSSRPPSRATSSSPHAAPPTTPPSTPSTPWASWRASTWAWPPRASTRSTARRPTTGGRWSSASASPVPRRTWSASSGGARAGRPDAGHHQHARLGHGHRGGAPPRPARRPRAGGGGHQDVHGDAGRAGHARRPASPPTAASRRPRPPAGRPGGSPRPGGRGPAHRGRPGGPGPLRRARSWLPLRHGPRVGAQAQGAGLRAGRSVLLGRLHPRAAGAHRGRLPDLRRGPARRDQQRHGGRHRDGSARSSARTSSSCSDDPDAASPGHAGRWRCQTACPSGSCPSSPSCRASSTRCT